MTRARGVERVLSVYGTIPGSRVRLHRAFGYEEVPLFDPFLMFDDFQPAPDRKLPRGVPMAPAPGDRDGNLHARG